MPWRTRILSPVRTRTSTAATHLVLDTPVMELHWPSSLVVASQNPDFSVLMIPNTTSPRTVHSTSMRLTSSAHLQSNFGKLPFLIACYVWWPHSRGKMVESNGCVRRHQVFHLPTNLYHLCHELFTAPAVTRPTRSFSFLISLLFVPAPELSTTPVVVQLFSKTHLALLEVFFHWPRRFPFVVVVVVVVVSTTGLPNKTSGSCGVALHRWGRC